jgi:hypothetical protein
MGVDMAVADIALARFEIGRVIRRMFSVVADNIVTFALLSLLPSLSMAAIGVAAGSFGDGTNGFVFPPFNTLVLIVGLGLFYILSGVILQGGVVHGAVASLNGKRASAGDCLATGMKYAVPLFLIGLLMMLGIFAGAILLIVPGIILAMSWVAVGPACIVEHTGVFGSFKRSRELARGHRWAIFGLYLLVGLLMILIAMIFGALSLALSGVPDSLPENAAGPALPELVGDVISTMVTSILGSALAASVYYELRQIKEGIGPEALASVFD